MHNILNQKENLYIFDINFNFKDNLKRYELCIHNNIRFSKIKIKGEINEKRN